MDSQRIFHKKGQEKVQERHRLREDAIPLKVSNYLVRQL